MKCHIRTGDASLGKEYPISKGGLICETNIGGRESLPLMFVFLTELQSFLLYLDFIMK